MKAHPLLDAFASWITCVAETVLAVMEKLRAPRRVRLIEEEPDLFRVELAHGRRPGAASERIRICDGMPVDPLPAAVAAALNGSRLAIVLRPQRFLFRPLELPARAAEFLDGIIRAQIDRLTPWPASEAAFGWTSPHAVDNDRMSVTVGATARSVVVPYVQLAARLGARMVEVAAAPPEEAPHAAAIVVHRHSADEALGVLRMRRALATAFMLAGVSAVAATGAAQLIGSDLDARHSDLSRRLSQYRMALRPDASGNLPARQLLERRKQGTAASVLVLEALSRSLPDHTYVTELRIDGDKLQVVGVTQDAPSLIRLMEQSPHFTRATFFAPTTRSPGDSGERFHIEARLNPVFTRS